MADIACVPYMTRLEMLSMEALWSEGRRPRLAHWWQTVKARESYRCEIEAKFPQPVRAYMLEQGRACWPQIRAMVEEVR